MKIYKSNNFIINLEEVNYIVKRQEYKDKYCLTFNMKNGSEFNSVYESEEKIIFKMDYIAKLMEK